MSLARAFTKRMKGQTEAPSARSNNVRYAAGSIRRDMISLPTELISTTNVQALNAPDISSLNKSNSSGSSVSSANDSDFASIDKSFLSDPDRTDSSSIEMSSPATPITPPMESSRGFFDAKQPSISPVVIADPVPDIPTVPQRAPSHSKKAHVELSRQRSIQRMSPPPNTITEKPARSTADFFGSEDPVSQPFARELAKVNEIAEEFNATSSSAMDEEEQEILSKGYHKFSVEDYINEIAGLYGGGVFDNRLGPLSNPWV